MIRLPINKVLAAAVLAVLLSIYIQHDHAKWGQRGREAFLTYQGARFDHYMGSSHLMVVSILAAFLVTGLVVLVYEALVAVISKIFLPVKR